MATKIQIISSALILLGENPTNTIGTDAPKAVQTMLVLYDIFYKALLSMNRWNFALKSAPLSKINGAPKIDGWAYAYELPEDYLLISKLQPQNDFKIFGTYLYTNINNEVAGQYPTLIYVHRINESFLPAYFTEIWILKLASINAMNITANENLASRLEAKFEALLRKSQALDAQSQSPEDISGKLQIRGGGIGRYRL